MFLTLRITNLILDVINIERIPTICRLELKFSCSEGFSEQFSSTLEEKRESPRLGKVLKISLKKVSVRVASTPNLELTNEGKEVKGSYLFQGLCLLLVCTLQSFSADVNQQSLLLG